MTKFVLVEAINTFRMRYVVQLNDNDPAEWAMDTVVMEPDEELGQIFLGQQVMGHRVVDADEVKALAVEDNKYIKDWTTEQVLDLLTVKVTDE